MQVTSQCRVDASLEWVRAFLLAGTREDDVTVDGDLIEVRQRDRLIDLVVRNRLSADDQGGTVLDVDANLRLLGLARVVGGRVPPPGAPHPRARPRPPAHRHGARAGG